MPERRAVGRLRGAARRLPAVLLSGIFVLVTAGLPASAAATYTREPTATANSQEAGDSALTAEVQLPDAVSPAAPSGSEPGLVPPATAGTIVSPLGLHGLDGAGRADAALAQTRLAAAHPDRGPPAGQQ